MAGASRKRNHFVRFLKRDAVNQLIDQLSAVAERKFDHVRSGQDFFEIKAPDGDVVLSGLRKQGADYICRLHREVFSENTA
jgi:hypothetical protein